MKGHGPRQPAIAPAAWPRRRPYCITAFNTRPDVNPAELSSMLLTEHGIVISGGLDELAGRIFRVGHMGKARSDEYINGFLDAVKAYLEMAGLPLAA